MAAEQCAQSDSFPTNYDGEFTRCPGCNRKLSLTRGGRLPKHNTTPPKPPKLLPRGESIIDGRLCGTNVDRATRKDTVSTRPCKNCGTDNPRHLCDTCVTQLKQMLDQVPWLLDELDARIQKLDRVNTGTIGRTRTQDSLDVMDFAASEKARKVRKMLLHWVIDVVQHHTGRTPPGLSTVTTPDLARWLHVNTAAIAQLPAAGQLYHDIHTLVGADTKRTGILVTAINPTQRHLVGPCPTPTGRDRHGQRTHCGHILYADTYDTTVTCPDCGHDIDVEKTRRAAAAERDYHTAEQIIEVMANCGEPVDPDTLQAWIKAKRLRPAGRLHNGAIVPTHTHDDKPYVYSVKRARKLRARDLRSRRNTPVNH